MTVFVNKEAARNLAANRAAIANKTDVSCTYQGFFGERVTTVRPSPNPASPNTASPNDAGARSTTSAADPSSLRRELDK